MTLKKQRTTGIRPRRNRFAITAPTTFSWRAQDGVLHQAKGTTRNLSAEGVYICSEQAPMTGSPIDVIISIGSLEVVQFAGSGVVLRIDSAEGRVAGFAVQLKLSLRGERSNP